MDCASALVFSLLCVGVNSVEYNFPTWFKFGAASASYQVEGAWNVSDKGESMWDRLLHTRPEVVADRSNGDVACDSYHLWRRDIQLTEELGLDMYRFSISWPRLLPTGFPNIVSEDGKRFYSELIDGLLEKGIEPVVTLYHFDLPQSLQDLGGWANPLIADWFADYADVVFSLYADRVKVWVTINEALGVCAGYHQQAAPYIDDPKIGGYLCNKNTLLAHAKAYRVYDEKYRQKYNGKVSLTTLFFWFEPATPEDADITELTFELWVPRVCYYWSTKMWLNMTNSTKRLTSDLHNPIGKLHSSVRPEFKIFESADFSITAVIDVHDSRKPQLNVLFDAQGEGRFAHPIFSKEGGWPKKLEQKLLENGIKEGYQHPRLPTFTSEEIELVRGTYDYYGLNHYTTRLVRKLRPGEKAGIWPFYGSEEIGMQMVSDPSWKTSAADWFAIYPEGLRKQLHWLNTTYDLKEIIILENGLITVDPGLVDIDRLEYIRDHLEQVALAISDGIPVTGYTAWTLMDNFEWLGGYSAKFGLYAVDFNDPNRTRSPRESARFYSSVAKTRTLRTIDDDLINIL